MTNNNHDLARYIPSEVRRTVRQRDGFGCIVCGSFFYHYDHLGIEFKDAKLHEADNIVLLCGGCHDRKNRGALSTETIKIAAKNPRCKQKSFSWGPLDTGLEHPIVQMGSLIASNVKSLIRVDGEDVFSISPPSEEGSPFTINAKIYDRGGRLILRIVESEVQVLGISWDVEVVGQRVIIRSFSGIFDLILRVEPPRKIIIERMNMVYKGLAISCSEGKALSVEFGGMVMSIQSAEVSGGDTMFDLSSSGFEFSSGSGIITGFTLGPSEHNSPSVPMSFSDQRFPRQPRNELCSCGSGKKYKRCHGAL
ncbi:SEC-C metal-binding domain-containing protein [Pseudomonas fulva]|uniref:HNH endonuclease n=1 Tax=Pseudomonas fulva TaxID=47880 RepID=UPI003824C318